MIPDLGGHNRSQTGGFMTRLAQGARVLVVVLSLTGCSASMVSRPGDRGSSPYAPVNESQRGGVIKYQNMGLQALRDKRREDAYKQMSNACGGRYRIDAEGPRTEGGVVSPVGKSASFATSEYWYIQFSCVHDSALTDSVSKQWAF